RDRTPLDSSDARGLPLDQAYLAQHLLVQTRTDTGERAVGVKLGFTSREKMQQMGVHSPIAGSLTSGMQILDGGEASLDSYIHPRVEPEVAFLLGSDLDPEAPMAVLQSAVAAVAPALEIID